MAAYAGTMARRRSGWLGGRLGRALVVFLGMVVAGLAGAPIAYMLWPRAAPIAPDAPSMPITVGGVVFNVPPAAIRVAMQRRPGTQPRIDMTFLWPSLEPPNAAIKPSPNAMPNVTDRLFINIAGSDGTLAPVERLKAIYPRYAAGAAVVGPDGLAVQGFRTGSPYQGEDLIHHPAEPERFLLRCTKVVGAMPAMCLHERRIAGADITVRFPRQWLADWPAVASAIDRLIAGFRPSGG